MMAARISGGSPAKMEARRSASQVSTRKQPNPRSGIESSSVPLCRIAPADPAPCSLASASDSFIDKLAASQMHMVRSARKLRLRGRESHRRSDSGSVASVADYEDEDDDPTESLFREFGEAAASAQRELAQAVSEEVEQQLADVLVCLGEEAAKIEVLSGALARMGVDAPGLLSDNGLGASSTGDDDATAIHQPSTSAPRLNDADVAYARDTMANAERIAAKANAFLMKPASGGGTKPPKPPGRRSRISSGGVSVSSGGAFIGEPRALDTPPGTSAPPLVDAGDEISPEESRVRDRQAGRVGPAGESGGSQVAPLTKNILEDYYHIGRSLSSTPVSRVGTDDEGAGAWDGNGDVNEDEHTVRARIETWEGEILRSRRGSAGDSEAPVLRSQSPVSTPHERAMARDREMHERKVQVSSPSTAGEDSRRRGSRGLMMMDTAMDKNGWMQVSQSTF